MRSVNSFFADLVPLSLAYGPNVYFLTRYIGRLRAALVATAASDQVAEHEKLMQHGGEEAAKEVKKTMAFLLVINVKKSPFFVDAEEDSYEALADALVLRVCCARNMSLTGCTVTHPRSTRSPRGRRSRSTAPCTRAPRSRGSSPPRAATSASPSPSPRPLGYSFYSLCSSSSGCFVSSTSTWRQNRP